MNERARDSQERLVREPECRQITGLGRTTRFKLEKIGEFPKRRRVSTRVTGWLFSELVEFLRTRSAPGPSSATTSEPAA